MNDYQKKLSEIIKNDLNSSRRAASERKNRIRTSEHIRTYKKIQKSIKEDFLEIPETDKAYLAGLVDGEGCISIVEYLSKRTPTPIMYLHVSVTSVDKDYLVYYRKLTGLGGVHPCAKESGNCRATFQWWIASKKAIALLTMIYPYLKIKKEQADIAFKFQETMNKSFGGKGEGCIKGGKKVNPDILLQRQRYKQALTRMKGYKTKRGRPKKGL